MSVCGVVGDIGAGSLRSSVGNFRLFNPPDYAASRFTSLNKCLLSNGRPNVGVRLEVCRMRNFRVNASEKSGANYPPIAPLELESPTGQFLSQIMLTHPHLLPSAIDQQLERLQEEGNSQKEDKPPVLQDLLYRRIAEIKEKERNKTLEEIIYCVVVQKFMDNNISMVPTLSASSDPTIPVDSWPNQEHKLENIHSPDALEMIQSHLSLILGERVVGPLSTIVHISKVKLGKLYAASIMYGYFLKRVDQRYQLERKMNTLPQRVDGQTIFDNVQPNPWWDMESMVQISSDGEDIEVQNVSNFDEEAKLRAYVMHLDAETLQRYATMRSKEAISLIEKQTQSLFGRPDIRIADDGTIDVSNDETVGISSSGLSLLVLEAVAFGTFLWGAEGYVESKYHFLTS